MDSISIHNLSLLPFQWEQMAHHTMTNKWWKCIGYRFHVHDIAVWKQAIPSWAGQSALGNVSVLLECCWSAKAMFYCICKWFCASTQGAKTYENSVCNWRECIKTAHKCDKKERKSFHNLHEMNTFFFFNSVLLLSLCFEVPAVYKKVETFGPSIYYYTPPEQEHVHVQP